MLMRQTGCKQANTRVDSDSKTTVNTQQWFKSLNYFWAAEYGIAAHKISRHLAKGAPKLRDWSLTKIFAPCTPSPPTHSKNSC